MIHRKYVGLGFPSSKVPEFKALIASAKSLAASRGISLGALIISAFESFVINPESVESMGTISRSAVYRMLVPHDYEDKWAGLFKALRIEAIRQDVRVHDIFYHILCKLGKEKN